MSVGVGSSVVLPLRIHYRLGSRLVRIVSYSLSLRGKGLETTHSVVQMLMFHSKRTRREVKDYGRATLLTMLTLALLGRLLML